MKFILFSASFICFSHLWGSWTCLGHNYTWECLNDYLFTITCVLNTSSDHQPREIIHYLELCDDRDSYRCKSVERSWVCVFQHRFTDIDSFTISLNSSIHGKSTLETDYMPKKHIRPVPPLNLSMLWEGDQAVFHWLSGYDANMYHVQHLHYKLSIRANDKVWDFSAAHAKLTVPASWFAPSTSYTARVRSAPTRQYYDGVWSHWGPALHWTTARKEDGTLWLTLLAPFGLVLFGLLFLRWKRCVLIPSPVPHIGDIKHSAMADGLVADLLQQEVSLKINNMIEDPKPHPHDISDPYEIMRGDHTSVTFTPPSPVMLQSNTGSKISWTEAFMTSEKGGLTCSEGYCTLAHAQ